MCFLQDKTTRTTRTTEVQSHIPRGKLVESSVVSVVSVVSDKQNILNLIKEGKVLPKNSEKYDPLN